MKNIALVGCGSLGTIIAHGIMNQLSGYYTIIAVLDNRPEAAKILAKECSCKACDRLEDLLFCKPDYVIEAAAPTVLCDIAIPVLEADADLLPLSIGAFADTGFYNQVNETAAMLGRHVYIVSGAIGGFDLMQAAAMVGPLTARIINNKAPQSLNGAPGLGDQILPDDHEMMVFSGSARQAIEGFPKNVNVAVALALNTTGVDETHVEINSVPGLQTNIHRILLSGEFGEATIEVASRPSRDNPKSSATAAYSVLAKLKNLAEPISFC